MKIREDCQCCYGTGICEDIYGNQGACMTCNGKGYFEFEDLGKIDELTDETGENEE